MATAKKAVFLNGQVWRYDFCKHKYLVVFSAMW